MKKHLRWLWQIAWLTFIYGVAVTTDVSAADCIIYLLLMCYIVKDSVLELWQEVFEEE